MGKIFLMLLFLIFSAPIAAADALCARAGNTIEISECLAREIAVVEQTLQQYLAASRARYQADEPQVVEQLEAAQAAWEQYQAAHCQAVYDVWVGGTIRGNMFRRCQWETTMQRTHEVWRHYLTYMDSTKPILPEPVID